MLIKAKSIQILTVISMSDRQPMVAQDVTNVEDLLYSGLKSAPEATQYCFTIVPILNCKRTGIRLLRAAKNIFV